MEEVLSWLLDLLHSTETSSMCPYKGAARYRSLRVGETVHVDLARSYETPLPESAPIAGLVAFYDEWVDLIIDGEIQSRPKTRFG